MHGRQFEVLVVLILIFEENYRNTPSHFPKGTVLNFKTNLADIARRIIIDSSGSAIGFDSLVDIVNNFDKEHY